MKFILITFFALFAYLAVSGFIFIVSNRNLFIKLIDSYFINHPNS